MPRHIIGLAAAVAFWFVISVETHTYFTALALAERDPDDAAHQRWLGQMALSVVWAAYAGALAAAGFVRRAAQIRWVALVLFAVTVVKAMFVDIAELQQLYRIIVFFVLGIFVVAGRVGIPQSISFAGVTNMKNFPLRDFGSYHAGPFGCGTDLIVIVALLH